LCDAFDSGKFCQVWGRVPSIISNCDYSLLNLECPIVDNNPKPIHKTGPNLKCSSVAVKAIKFAGFNGVTLANNHFRDFGDDGVFSTIDILRQNKIDYVGGGSNLKEASRVLRKRIGKYDVSFVNMCENEWSIASDYHGGANPIDPMALYYQIQSTKKSSDYTIVILHGGKELYRLPTPRMKKLFRYIIDLGADAVINHHQHCYSGYETYQGKPIFYGLGNFLFDKGTNAPDVWNDGLMVEFDLDNNLNFKIIPYRQCAEEAMIDVLVETTAFDKNLSSLNKIIQDDELLQEKFNELVNSNIRIVKGLADPYWGRLMRGIIRRIGWPYLQNANGYKLLLANLQCQTHSEIFLSVLRKIINK
jgi:poly-gamma-glutamate synthesis protein (capsule biosynthesis protein)